MESVNTKLSGVSNCLLTNFLLISEKAIVTYQEEELALDKEREQLELAGKPIPDNLLKPCTTVPPIPVPPVPPSLKEMGGTYTEDYTDQHPLGIPKTSGKQQHLDMSCFHITEGRYFGLKTNFVADPHFVGPNAPGLVGLTLSGGTGLATAARTTDTKPSTSWLPMKSEGFWRVTTASTANGVVRLRSPMTIEKIRIVRMS